MLFAAAAAARRFTGFAVKLSGATVGRVPGSPKRHTIVCVGNKLLHRSGDFFFIKLFVILIICEFSQPAILVEKDRVD